MPAAEAVAVRKANAAASVAPRWNTDVTFVSPPDASAEVENRIASCPVLTFVAYLWGGPPWSYVTCAGARVRVAAKRSL